MEGPRSVLTPETGLGAARRSAGWPGSVLLSNGEMVESFGTAALRSVDLAAAA